MSIELLKANRKRQLYHEIEEMRNNPAYAKYLPEDFPDTKQQDQVPTKCEDKYVKHLQYLKSKGVDGNDLEILEKIYENFCLYLDTKKKKKPKDNGNGGPPCDDLAPSDGDANLEYSKRLSDTSSISDCHQSNNQMDSDTGAINSSQEQYDPSDDGESDSSEESTESARPDEFDLDEEETTYYRTSLRQSDLFMNMQGFSTCVSSGHAQTEITTFLHDKAALEYKGKTYYQGRVYEYQHHIGKDHLVGIHSFIREDMAECVEVAKFEDTFIGVVAKGVEDNECLSFKLSDFPSYVQVKKTPCCFITLPLSNFGRPFLEHPTMPEMVYELQNHEDNWDKFAYYLCNGNEGDTIRRCGLRSSALTVKEYFAGAGGSHEAYKSKGFEVYCLVEKDDIAVKSLVANNAKDESKIYHGCVADALNQHNEHGTPPDACHFSPPCCGFSRANRYGGANDKNNNDLSLLFVKMLHVDKPKVACFENVTGMWRRKFVHYLLNIIAGTLKEGYQVRCSKLNTSNYGDPQSRNRLFLLASMNGLPLPLFPPKRYGEGLLPAVTVGHVMKKSEDDDICSLPEQVTRLRPDKPAPTIIAQGRQPLHPFEGRMISVQDMLVLMSLPPRTFAVKGSRKERRRQVGNMIPFKTMSSIAEEMKSVVEFHYDI